VLVQPRRVPAHLDAGGRSERAGVDARAAYEHHAG